MSRRAGKIFLQHVDQVQTGFDRQHLINFELSRQAQVRMSTWRIDRRTEVVALMPTDVMHLDAEQMSQSMRIKRRRNTCFDQSFGAAFCNADLCQ